MFSASLTLVFAVAIGFVVAGIVSNVFQLVTDDDLDFHFPVTSDAHRLAMIGLLLLAAPNILVRAANRSIRVGDWPFLYTVGCFSLAALWSFGLGYCVLRIFIPV